MFVGLTNTHKRKRGHLLRAGSHTGKKLLRMRGENEGMVWNMFS
jgi:hypothetical protein